MGWEGRRGLGSCGGLCGFVKVDWMCIQSHRWLDEWVGWRDRCYATKVYS